MKKLGIIGGTSWASTALYYEHINRGVAQRLDAKVMGSGDVTAARVTGAVHKSVMGSGEVRTGD